MSVTLRRGRAPKGTYRGSGEFVRACRAELGWSQRELAEVLVRSVGTVQDWEWGKGRVPATCYRALLSLVSWKRTGVRPVWLDPVLGRD